MACWRACLPACAAPGGRRALLPIDGKPATKTASSKAREHAGRLADAALAEHATTLTALRALADAIEHGVEQIRELGRSACQISSREHGWVRTWNMRNMSERSTRRNAAVLFALGSMLSAQLGAALSRPYFHRVGPAGVVWIRLLFAGVALLLYARPSLTRRSRRELFTAVALGVASGFLMLAFFEAIARIPLGIAVAIEFLGPLGVALVGSRRLLDGLWVALAAGGIALLTLGHPVGGALDPLGVLLALGAAAGWAAYIVLTQRVGRSWPGTDGLAVSLGVAAVVTAPFGLAGGPGRFAHRPLLLAGLGLAVLLPLAPFLLEFAALRRLPTRVFGVLMSLEPAIGALIGLVVLGQGLAIAGVGAIALIITASLGATLTSRGVDAATVIVV